MQPMMTPRMTPTAIPALAPPKSEECFAGPDGVAAAVEEGDVAGLLPVVAPDAELMALEPDDDSLLVELCVLGV